MDYQEYFRFLLALLFVLGLLGGLTLLARKLGLAGPALTKLRNGESNRVEVIQTVPIDVRRRLLLIRRDDVEHLVLLGTNEDLLIESGIQKNKSLAPDDQDRQSAGNSVSGDSTGSDR